MLSDDTHNITSVVLSQTSKVNSNGDNSHQLNEQEFTKIFDDLCSKIRTLSSEISQENETTTIADSDAVEDEPKRILQSSLTLMKKFNVCDLPRFYTQVLLDLWESILNEEKTCKNSFRIHQDGVEKITKELQCYHKHLEMLKARKSKPTQHEVKIKEKFVEAVNKEFRQCKADLKTVLETMYPNDSSQVKDFLSELIDNAPIDDKETEIKWYDITKVPEYIEIINTFDNAGIITHHEDNINLIRLII